MLLRVESIAECCGVAGLADLMQSQNADGLRALGVH